MICDDVDDEGWRLNIILSIVVEKAKCSGEENFLLNAIFYSKQNWTQIKYNLEKSACDTNWKGTRILQWTSSQESVKITKRPRKEFSQEILFFNTNKTT